jgi:hypothetical protein
MTDSNEQYMTNLLTLSEIENRLRDRRLQVVSAITGISYPIIKKLSYGSHDNYNLKTLEIISDYLQKFEKHVDGSNMGQ